MDGRAEAGYKGYVTGGPNVHDRLIIFDTTLRDGEQAPGFSMRIDEKLKMARQLASLGVDIIEAGFPIASDADAEAVRMVSTHIKGPVIAALARCNRADIERAAWALEPAARKRIHVFIATSDLHLERKLRMSRSHCLKVAMDAVRLARTFTDDVQFSAEDATRSDPRFPVARGRGGHPVGRARPSTFPTPSATRRPTKCSRSSRG